MTNYTVHTRSCYGVYTRIGDYVQRQDALKALAEEVAEGHIATAWVRFYNDTLKIYEWDHDHDTLADAQSAAGCIL